MYYQAGDYYRGGDYYKAGGIGSFFKAAGRAIKGTVGGAVKGFIKGGPLGGIVGAGTGAIAAGRANATAAALESGPTGSAYTPELRAKHNAAIVAHRQLAAQHTQAAKQLGAGGRGFGGRRMNTLNPRALSRATRRIKGFEEHAKKSLRALGLHVVRHVTKAPARSGRR